MFDYAVFGNEKALKMFLDFAEVQLEQKSIPTAVFGGLKEDWKNSAPFQKDFWYFI